MRTKTYFISDMHIGAGYIPDTHRHQRTLARWLRSIAHDAKAIYLLGDILDYWYEYRTVAPRGYVRFLGALAELADSGVQITWLKGNHDIWIYDYLPSEIGLTVADGVIDRHIDGRRFVMEHGDGVGETRWSYRLMRSGFRCRILQILYSAIHPRWTVGLAHRWSRHSRLKGTQHTNHDPLPPGDKLLKWAETYQKENGPVDYFIFGHRHTPIDRPLPSGNGRIIILGEAYRLMTYGVWDGHTFHLQTIP